MKYVHCSYHKCLTVYFSRVFSNLYNKRPKNGSRYKHFKSLLNDFYQHMGEYRVASINNHALDLQRLGDEFCLTRFIRDPRDLIVSGYYYHKLGTEKWCKIVNPKESDWEVVNGSIPKGMSEGHSYTSYLNGLSKEEGMLAEIDFRKKHFDSMRRWPMDDQRIKLFYYEDLIGNEVKIFKEIFKFYRLSWSEQRLALQAVRRFSVKNQIGKSVHIRKYVSGQWKEEFTPRVKKLFDCQYNDIIARYGYERKYD